MNQLIIDTKTLNGDGGGVITAINMTINPTDCDEHCNATVTVTWVNAEKERAKFRPAIKINGTKMDLGIEITLIKNQTTTQTFNLMNLTQGTYDICPYPN